ncbi:MAG: hypothetical protein JSV80_06500 [Acidobacteriota bacterium]|nr:MAG: hypothetical protein JSV80_06500 [Acidobacteriota bacterium]
MAAAMNHVPLSGALADAVEMVARLLERADRELEDAERPLCRLTATRCLEHVLAAVEQLMGCRARSLNLWPSALTRAQHHVDGARCTLELLQRRGSVAPSACRELSAGLAVVERRLAGLRTRVSHRGAAGGSTIGAAVEID